MRDPERKIPYNYTSAADDQIIVHLFGSDILKAVQALDAGKRTGRSARLLNRFMGDLFIIERNPFLFEELVSHPGQRKRLLAEFENDLTVIEQAARHKQVFTVLAACRNALQLMEKQIASHADFRLKLLRTLGPVIGKHNICFDPFTLTAHTTDATDWRRFVPKAVLRPDRESQVPELVRQIKKLGLCIIPRGAGTGLTGGATPLTPDCVMVNTEKLNRILSIEPLGEINGRACGAIALEAGVITQDAKDAAGRQGWIFATDPTSAWACTIGGNLAENAGGKTAVLFGTALDNVLSYTIVMADGSAYRVTRKNHPGRKILFNDRVIFAVSDLSGREIRTISLTGEDIRKKGLGKDVTNKHLNGLPGIQKEGCDGIITSARFILYPRFLFKKTCCIEFFGNDMTEAGQVIAAVSKAFANTDPAIMALEHFDEAYIKAIRYKTKQALGNRLKAVLLVDMVSNDEGVLHQGIQMLSGILAQFDQTGFTIAQNDREAARFWEDRKRLGAIAAHTNAFKLNEDIVLPLDSLAAFVRFVDQTNLAEKAFIQTQVIDNMVAYLDRAVPLADPQWLKKKVARAKDLGWAIKKKLAIASRDALEAGIHARNFFQQVTDSLRGYSLVLETLETIFEATQARLIVIATHMHAGDGNVHVNIPVLSNDREMMARAAMIADRIMEKAKALNGVVSGEHGIGITKFKHLDPAAVKAFEQYRDQVDPDRIMNPGKLSEPGIIQKVFTPSFNLLELEARILKHGSLSQLAISIAGCVRCGKCKPLCPVFYAGRNLFFHPRNKNLALGSLIEAMLYVTQRTRSTGFQILKNMEQIADHCTICHRCLEKCPVNIDSGRISIEAREILKTRGFKHTPLATRTTLAYLGEKRPLANRLARPCLLGAGTFLQRSGARLLSPLANTRPFTNIRTLQLVRTRMPRPDSTTLRTMVPLTDKNQAILLEPPGPAVSTVFYFPGCGSERVYSRISRAAIFLLLSGNHRVVLPPPFLCCGYPFKVNARTRKFQELALKNIIVLTQIRDMFHDLSFDAFLVSCGTCMESLTQLDAAQIFDCPVADVAGYVLNYQKNRLNPQASYLYHVPCHDSLKDEGVSLFKSHGFNVTVIPFCCSEAGTLALSRPDISDHMRVRKQAALNTLNPVPNQKILTHCPSCLQGLGRLSHATPIHLAQELAILSGGAQWDQTSLKDLAATTEKVTF
jgi:FAD/FMN-containing dehydrogenase/Fe-S oxidoreductase